MIYDLPSYLLRAMTNAPRFSADDEHDLIVSAQAGSSSARNRLVESSLRFLVHVASRYVSARLPLEDLLTPAIEALVDAIDRFDPSRESRLASYAYAFVRRRMLEEIAARRSVVRRIGTPPCDLSTDAVDLDRGAEDPSAWIVAHVDRGRSRAALRRSLFVLTPHQRKVLSSRYSDRVTSISEVAVRRGVSRQAVSETEKRALRRLRRGVLKR